MRRGSCLSRETKRERKREWKRERKREVTPTETDNETMTVPDTATPLTSSIRTVPAGRKRKKEEGKVKSQLGGIVGLGKSPLLILGRK